MNDAETPKPLVSVIVPTYNRAKLLRGALSSILCQSFTDFELIVVDDASTDDTRAVVQALGDARVRYIRREVQGGVARARNTGVQIARGTYLAFNDSDDEWLLEKLKLQMQVMTEGGAQCDMVICGLLRIGKRMLRQYPQREDEWDAQAITYFNIVGSPFAYTQTWLVRREAVLQEGGFDETLRVWDDWELLIRLSRKLRIRPLREMLVISDTGTGGISAEGERFTADMGRILEKHFDHIGQHPQLMAELEYVYAHLLISSKRVRDARRALLRSLKHRPLRVRSWIFLLGTLLGDNAMVKKLRDIARSVLRPFR